MSALNGHDPLMAAVEAAKQQEAQEQVLRQVLNQALNQPARVTQVTGPSLIHVVENPTGGRVLLIAQVTGDRWDIPVDDQTARRIAFALAKAGGTVQAADTADESSAEARAA